MVGHSRDATPASEVAAAVAAGAHVIVEGAATVSVPGLVVRVAANGDATLGPLEEARLAIARVVGESARAARSVRVAMSVRRRLLGERWEPQAAAAFVEACNRLRARGDDAALLIERAQLLDDATRGTLTAVVASGTGLELPLIFCFGGAAPTQCAPALVDALLRGGAAVVRVPPRSVAPEPAFDIERLDPDMLRVLRPALVLGEDLTVEGIAELLDQPPFYVLEELQRAADVGLPIADRGGGRFAFPTALIEELRTRTLPSLLTHLHRRAAQGLIDSNESAPPPAPAVDSERPRYEDVFDGGPAAEAASTSLSPSPPGEPTYMPPVLMTAAEEAQTARGVDPARAAAHLEAAGEPEGAIVQLLAAAEEAAHRGDPRRGLALIGRAKRLLREEDRSAATAVDRARLERLKGEILWHGATLGPPFTLDGALEAFDAAAALVPEGQPLLRAEIFRAQAGVLYDRGDVRSLEAALGALTEAIRGLSAAGLPRQAASLFNDQASVYLRAGDPVRAFHLMTRAQTVFEEVRRRDPDDVMAAIELAETDHLLARLPLHAQLRAGREDDAFGAALDHARAAERVYREIGDPHALGRVTETMGRLELSRGRVEQAVAVLERGLALQRRIGDVVGLARTAAALSDACLRAGKAADALALLSDSIELNARKGSAIGLAYNRRALAEVAEWIDRDADGHSGQYLSPIEARLAEAEARVGRVSVPGDS